MPTSENKLIRFVEQLARAELTDCIDPGVEGEPWQTLARLLEEVRRGWQAERDAAVDQATRQVIALSDLASRDGLTGLLNRRAMNASLEKGLRRSKQEHKPLSVAMLDLDLFKQTNDHYGHAAGDAVLREVADVMRTNVRQYDSACRAGGEEFVIIFPGAPRSVAHARITSILQCIRELEIQHDQVVIKSTASAGLASYPEDGTEPNQLLEAADAALYRAKAAGRDRLEPPAEVVLELEPTPHDVAR